MCVLMILAHFPAGVLEVNPMKNRGASAWTNVQGVDTLGRQHPQVSRLLSHAGADKTELAYICLLYTSPSPRD